MANKPLYITDTILRDAHQSQAATRMKIEDMIPALERLQKEGEEGRKKIAAITRVVTIVLGVLQSTAYYFYLRSQGYLVESASGKGAAAVFAAFVIILCFTAGTALIMWLGERINEKGIGNGISMILFAGIVSRIPSVTDFLACRRAS